MSNKTIILEGNGDEPPDGLKIDGPFKRLGILNPAVVQYGSLVLIKTKSYEK